MTRCVFDPSMNYPRKLGRRVIKRGWVTESLWLITRRVLVPKSFLLFMIFVGIFDAHYSHEIPPPQFPWKFIPRTFRQDIPLVIPIVVSSIIDHPRSGMVYCGYVCLSDDNFRKPWRKKFIFAHAAYFHYGSSSYTKVIGSRSRSQKPKRRKVPIPAM